MFELIIKNNELIAIKKEPRSNTRIDINEYIKSRPLSLQFFVDYFDLFVNQLKLGRLFACKMILESGIFDKNKKRVPLSEIKSLNIDLFGDYKKLIKEIEKIKSADKLYVYYCNDDIDILMAIIYHCISRGYYLRKCKKCGCFFFKYDKKGIYCNYCSKQNIVNSKEINYKKRKSDTAENTIHRIQSKLTARENYEYKYVLTKAVFNKDLQEQRKLKRIGKITDKQFDKWAMEMDKKARLRR